MEDIENAKKKNGKLFIKIGAITGTIITILTVIEVTIVSQFAIRHTRAENTKTYTQLAQLNSQQVSKHLEESLSALDFYINADISKSGNDRAIVQWLIEHQSSRSANFDYVAYVSSDGTFSSDIGTVTDVASRDYFKAIMAEGKDFYIDNPTPSRVSGKVVLHISRAIKRDGKNVGFFCGVMNFQNLYKLLTGTSLSESGLIALYQRSGELMVSSGDKKIIGNQEDLRVREIFANLHQIANQVRETDESQSVWVRMPEGKRIFIIDQVQYTDWILAIVLTSRTVYGVGIDIALFMVSFGLLLLIGIVISISIVLLKEMKPLKVVSDSILGIATGNADLTKRIEVKGKNNEIGRVTEGFNKFIEKLQDIMRTMKESKQELYQAGETLNASAEDTASAITQISTAIGSMGGNISRQSDSVQETVGAVNQIATNIESLNRMIEGQVSAIEQASAAVEQMIGNVNSVNSSVQKMAEQFKDLEDRALLGVQKQDDVNTRIMTIENESEALKEANTVISSIAEQTNLLAMNAAIEAAHAGEAGKGFSVVADEIRKLSETSSEQSRTIGNELNSITDSIEGMVKAAEESKNAFASVLNGIKSTNDLVSEIKNSMAEQGEGSKQISEALNHMNDSSQEVKTSALEMTDGNKQILSEANKLQNETSGIKSGMDEMNVVARKITETGNALKSLVDEMDASINKIGEEIDLFKV